MDHTPRFGMPLLVAGQAQKEIAHNEALAILDSLCAPAVEDGPADTPPETPPVGTSYIVGSAPTGAWSGQDGKLAIFAEGGWRFVDPPVGIRVFVASSGQTAEFRDSGWEYGVIHADAVKIGGVQVLSTQDGPIPAPSGGGTVDSEARTAIEQILSALRHHGLIAT